MKIVNYSGKFTIEVLKDILTVDAWQGGTDKFPIKRLPVAAMADCIPWLSNKEREQFEEVIGKRRYATAYKYAVQMHWL